MFLERAGIAATVYESRTDDERSCVSLTLAPNGLAILAELGIDHEVTSRGSPIHRIVCTDHRGRARAIVEEAAIAIERRVLVSTLREKAREHGIEIEMGKRLGTIEMTPEHVGALFEDGTKDAADILVGCDGVRSRTRRALIPRAPDPQYTERVETYGRARMGDRFHDVGTLHVVFGRRALFTWTAMANGEVTWSQTMRMPREPVLSQWSKHEWRAWLYEVHRWDGDDLGAILEQTEWIERVPVYEMPTLPTWHHHRVVLAGDAAHAMAPHLGQAASLALEDAMVLARALRDHSDPSEAFLRYERERRPRVLALANEAHRHATALFTTNAFSRGLRDLVLPWLIKTGTKHVQRAYGYRVDWAA